MPDNRRSDVVPRQDEVCENWHRIPRRADGAFAHIEPYGGESQRCVSYLVSFLSPLEVFYVSKDGAGK